MAYGLVKSADLERGTPHYFTRASSSLLQGGSAFTIEAWVKFESITSGGAAAYTIASKRVSGGNREYRFYAGFDGGSTYTLGLQASSAGGSFDRDTAVTWSPSPSNGTWYHVAVTWSSGTVKYYVDGSQMGSDQSAGGSSVYAGTGTFTIGAETTSGDPTDGNISLLRFWQLTRSGSDISTNMCNVLGATTSLSGEWTLDDTVNDNSGNSLTLTNVNSTPFVSDVPSTCSTVAYQPRPLAIGNPLMF